MVKLPIMKAKFIAVVLMLGAKLSLANTPQAAPPPTDRTQIFDAISGAQQRIFVLIPSLEDGALSSALYLAQYRGVDVRVGLWSEKAGHNQNNRKMTEVGLKVLHLNGVQPSSPCQMLIDQKVYSAERCHRENESSSWMLAANQNAGFQQLQALSKHTGFTPNIPKSMPVAEAKQPPDVKDGQPQEWHFAPYVYHSKRESRPEGVTKTLPKQMRWQNQ